MITKTKKGIVNSFHARDYVNFLRQKAQAAREAGNYEEAYKYDDILISLYSKHKEANLPG